MNLRAVLRADFRRTHDATSRLSILVFRLNQVARGKNILVRTPARLLNFLWLRIIIGAEMPASVKCGPGLRLMHEGKGIILNPRAVIGARAMIYHRVTIGGIGGVQGNVPIIGDDVYIGAGATIIGGVRVGDGARIGAGAIVVSDVPAGYTAVGPKATLLPPRSRREFVE